VFEENIIPWLLHFAELNAVACNVALIVSAVLEASEQPQNSHAWLGFVTHDVTPGPEYVPAAQLVHIMLPVVEVYCPAAHGVHVTEPVLKAYNPTKHAVHIVFPVFEAKWPAEHELHTLPRPVATEYRPVAQPMQLVDADAPEVVRY
jgi:hypothetical protein